jgi:hypothetical protein
MTKTPCNLYLAPSKSYLSRISHLIHHRLYLNIWPRLDHFLGGFGGVLLEVLLEKTSQFGDFLPEAIMSLAPCISRVQKFCWDTSAGLGHIKIESLVGLKFNLSKLTGVNSIKNGTCVFQSISISKGVTGKYL